MTDAFKCNDRVGELEGVDISLEVNILELFTPGWMASLVELHLSRWSPIKSWNISIGEFTPAVYFGEGHFSPSPLKSNVSRWTYLRDRTTQSINN